MAFAGTRGLLTVLPKAEILPRLDSVKVDFAALVFVCALTLLVSLLFSFVPLLRASRNHPSDALKVEGRGASTGTGKRRLGQMFVVSEFVFSLVLLILGVLLVQSFINLQRVDPGFDANNLLAFRIPVPEVNYGKFAYGAKDPRREKLYEQIERLLTDVPGVESVGFAAGLPLKQGFNASPVIITGREPPPELAKGKDVPLEESTATQMAKPQYFHALQVPLISGRLRMQSIVTQGNLPRTKAEITFRDLYPPMPPTAGNAALLSKLNEVNRAQGAPNMEAADPMIRGAGDASFVAPFVAVLDGLGAPGAGMHAPGESVDLARFPLQTKRVALLIYRLTQEPSH